MNKSLLILKEGRPGIINFRFAGIYLRFIKRIFYSLNCNRDISAHCALITGYSLGCHRKWQSISRF